MKKVLIILIIFILLIGGMWIALTQFIINPPKLAEGLEATLKQATGYEAVLSHDKAEISIWPLPQVSFQRFEIRNIAGASSENVLSGQSLTIRLDLPALFGGKAEPTALILASPVFELETLPDGSHNWQVAGKGRSGAAFGQYFRSVPITIENGTVRYTNAATGSQTEISGVEGELGYEKNGTLYGFDGTVAMHDDKARLLARVRSVDMTQMGLPETPLQFVFDYGGVNLDGSGMVKDASGALSFVGELKLEAANIWAVPAFLSGEPAQNQTKLAVSPKLTGRGKLTFDLKGFTLQDMVFEAAAASEVPVIKGTADMAYRFGKTPAFNLRSSLSSLDLDHALEIRDAWFGDAPEITSLETVENEVESNAASSNPWRVFLSSISGQFRLDIENAIWRGRFATDVAMRGGIKDGTLFINAANGTFPGNTKMAMLGETKRAEDGIWFNGSLQLEGDSLASFVSVFAPQGVELPPGELGSFLLRTNIAYNPSQFRLSEMQLRVNDARAAGAFIVHLADRFRIESFLRMKDVNLDALAEMASHFVPSTQPVAAPSADEETRLFDTQTENQRFDWLRSLGVEIKADLVMGDFVLWGRKGQQAEFKLNAGMGHASLSNVKARYNGADISGAFGIRLEAGKNPFIDIDAKFSEFNVVDVIPDVARTHNKDEWQAFLDRDLEFELLRSYRGKLKASFGELQIKDFEFKNATTEMELENAELDVINFSGSLWDGSVAARAKAQAGTIPTLSVSLALGNANLVKFSKTTPLLQHAAGTAGLRGQVATSGITLRSWLTNATGSLSLLGRDVSISGFGLSSLARAVPVARAVADLEKAKKQAMRGGVMRINEISGQMSISDGELFMPKMSLKSQELTGSFHGKVDLIKETVDITMQFYLNSTMEDGTAPTVRLLVSGAMDDLKKELQTQELDAYVARKSAERALRSTR